MGLFETTEEELVEIAMGRPLKEKIEQAVGLIRLWEAKALAMSDEGFYVAFSGGKDSIVMERLFQLAGVKYQNYYNNVTIDPPELVQFIKRQYPEVKWNNPEMHLLKKMVEKSAGPPTRMFRWCCEIYKEQGGNGAFKAIGVRAAESARRKGMWQQITMHRKTRDPIICPIIYWTDNDIWQFIRDNNMPYCSLYDEGFSRLGCVGCPMGGPTGQKREFERWPKYEAMWKKGVFGWWHEWKGVPRRDGGERAVEKFPTPESLWDWWISGKAYEGDKPDCQLWLW